jgi:UDP:flavonoid glycosyltransferase YjiC (YdhE family)
MNPDNLARRLEEACDRPELQARARRLQPVFLAEEGNLRTVDRIEKFLREVRP